MKKLLWVVLVLLLMGAGIFYCVGYRPSESGQSVQRIQPIASAFASPTRGMVAQAMFHISKQDFNGAREFFDDQPQRDKTLEDVQNNWNQILQSAGPINKFDVVKSEKKEGIEQVYIRCVFQKDTVVFRAMLTPQNKIASLDSVPSTDIQK
jgi:hypothetical protein